MQEYVTIVMPVSREQHLSKVFTALEMLECDARYTNLLVMVDGSDELFLKARNYVNESRFANVLCVRFMKSNVPALTFPDRRIRIAEIHEEMKQYLFNCKYVMGVEDDTIIPPKTLKYFMEDYGMNQFAGFIEGAELGRHRETYVGAWKFDDVYEPKVLESVMPDDTSDLQEIDAGGFYCFITRSENYLTHTFEPFEKRGMGPDVNYGISLRREGYSNYIDWRIRCEHIKEDGTSVSLATHRPQKIQYLKKGDRWVWNQYF